MSDRHGLIALAQAQRAAGHRVTALAYCQDVLARWPDDRDAQQLNLQLLSEIGASARALALSSSNGAPLDPTLRAQLRADYVAHEIRWANGEPADPRLPYAEADQAVADLRALLADPHISASIRQRANNDQLVALDQADRADETLAAYAALRKSGTPIAPYAEEAVADAMMQKHRPREAVQLYEDSIRRDPGPYAPSDTDPRMSLVFAYYDAGQMTKAMTMIDAIATSEPRWLYVPGVRTAKQNPRKVDVDVEAATIRQYAGVLSAAYAHLAELSAQAPASGPLRRDVAMAELARGWPRQAADSLRIADTLDARDANANLDEAEVLRTRYDYAGAQADLDQALQQAGRSGRVQNAAQAWQRQTGWQFDLAHDNGWGNSPDYGDRDNETDATLASPLIDDHWRVLALARYAAAALPEGEVSRDRAGAGVEGFYRDIQFYLQALPAWDRYVRRTALEGGFNWSISDHWSLSTDASTAGIDIPLRAQYYDISGKTLNSALQWRASELTSARLSLLHDNFSDGNVRNGWTGDFVQRLHTAPNLALDGGVEISGSHNSEVDRPYFNPLQDRSYALTGAWQNLLNQYDDRQWTERIDVSAGRYLERNDSAGWMASARYGQTFQPHGGLRFGWGVSWHSQPYDGRRESRVVLDLTLHEGE